MDEGNLAIRADDIGNAVGHVHGAHLRIVGFGDHGLGIGADRELALADFLGKLLQRADLIGGDADDGYMLRLELRNGFGKLVRFQ